MRTVVLISANAEWEGVKDFFADHEMTLTPFGESMNVDLGGKDLTFFHTGWGKTASAASIQFVIDHHHPDLIVNLGTCGGLEGIVQQGEIVLVEETFMYDIVELMGDLDIKSYYASSLDLSWLPDPLPYPVRRGLIASADSDLPPEMIPSLRRKGALAADWESAAFAWVAGKNNAKLLILRAVSDLVSEQGGEAYGDIEIFNQRAKSLIRELLQQLPAWIEAAGSDK